jgi:hypothetical protein
MHKLTSPEIKTLREKAERETLSYEEVSLFVAATRKSFLALPAKTPKALTSKKTPLTESEIDDLF